MRILNAPACHDVVEWVSSCEGFTMRIGVTSQNFRTVTGHAGKTRRFLIFEVDAGSVCEVGRLDLPKELSFHEFQGETHPLDGVDWLVTASCGEGFPAKMARRGIRVHVSAREEPAAAAREAFLKAAEPAGP